MCARVPGPVAAQVVEEIQLAAQTPAGTDINKVGIKPDVQLKAQPPLEPVGFCKFAGPAEVSAEGWLQWLVGHPVQVDLKS